MPDIVEIALNQITDFADFEKLACEILRNEGHPNIKPLGGLNDKGRDATAERYYVHEGRRLTVVFQITTQETLESKLKSTVSRLDDANIQYTQLTIVTSREISTDRQDRLLHVARDLDVQLDIIERKTLANRLSDFQNGIFLRHFPDIQAQVKTLVEAYPEDNLNPETLVRTALAFTASSESDRVRDHVLAELVFALLLHGRGQSASPDELVSLHQQLIPQAQRLQPDQIRAVLDRWVAAGMVERLEDGKYGPTAPGLDRAVASAMDWTQKGQIVCADVADSVERALGSELDAATRGLVERNALDALAKTFRFMGLEVASQLLGNLEARRDQLGAHEAIIEAVKPDLTSDLSEIVIAALAELLARPNEQQAHALTAYACGYVGASIMEVDPAVREFQVTRMNQKVFVLDTDFLIDCLAADLPPHHASRYLVEAIIASGARLIVPDACVQEAAKHAELADNTVRYFGDGIFGLTPVQALEQIHNAFARGWYFRSLINPQPFSQYIRNYYEPSAPSEYMRRVVKTILPSEVELGDVEQLLGVEADTELHKKLSEELLELIRTSRKREYRTEEHMKALADTDARLYTAAMAYEASRSADRRGKALGGACYLITSSSRFLRAVAPVIGDQDEISARPAALAGLFRLITRTSVSAKDFLALFDNPLLQHAIMQCREDVDRLLQAGLSTRNQTLARLVWDLDTQLHEKIAAVRASEQKAEETLGDAEEEQVSLSFLDLLGEAQRRGYSPLPSARRIIEELEALKADKADLSKRVQELTDRLQDMESTIQVFGGRKQRYLRRVARGEQVPKRRF